MIVKINTIGKLFRYFFSKKFKEEMLKEVLKTRTKTVSVEIFGKANFYARNVYRDMLRNKCPDVKNTFKKESNVRNKP